MSAGGPKRFQHVELVGEKVRLRPLSREDAPAAFNLLKDDRVTRAILWDGPSSVEGLGEGYDARSTLPSKESHGYDFAIEAVDSSGIIGSIGARKGSHIQQLDIGYWLGVPYWGKGLTTDAVRLATYFSFQHLNAVRVYATVFVGNTPSRRVLEKNGFVLDGTLRGQALKRGKWLDEWFLTLLRPEWESDRDWYQPQAETLVTV